MSDNQYIEMRVVDFWGVGVVVVIVGVLLMPWGLAAIKALCIDALGL